MQEMVKIVLSPTRFARPHAPDAIGSTLFDHAGGRVSMHLFNLPEPGSFLQKSTPSATYKGWLYCPESGEVRPIGKLTPGGEHLYVLYDLPLERTEGFHEVIVTAETSDEQTPSGEILLIGYLRQETTHTMAPFEPFDPPLPNHRWWKIRQDPTQGSAGTRTAPGSTEERLAINRPINEHPVLFDLPCTHCPQQRRPKPPETSQTGFYLPQIIGMATDKSGNLQYIVHGIPGRLLRSEQPDQGHTGYLHWQPYYGIEERIGAIGYWLCYINPETNQVTTPQGVTIPPGE